MGQLARMDDISIMEKESCIGITGAAVELVEGHPFENARPTVDSIDFMTFVDNEFDKIEAVIAFNSGYDGFLFLLFSLDKPRQALVGFVQNCYSLYRLL